MLNVAFSLLFRLNYNVVFPSLIFPSPSILLFWVYVCVWIRVYGQKSWSNIRIANKFFLLPCTTAEEQELPVSEKLIRQNRQLITSY